MTKQTKATGAKPSHRAYVVTGEGKSAFWTEIGGAWLHRDGQGFTINCAVLPLQGRIVVRTITERPAKAA